MSERFAQPAGDSAALKVKWPKLAAVGLLLAVLFLIYLFLLKPWLDSYAQLGESLESQQDLRERFSRVAAGRDELEARLEELKSRATHRPLFIKGASETLAAAALQEQVSQYIQNGGGSVLSIEAMQPQEEGSFAAVGVRVQFTGRYEAIYRALHSIESSVPYLFVEEMDFRSQRQRRRRNQEQETEETALLVALEIIGFLSPEEQ